jgi:MFS family permease
VSDVVPLYALYALLFAHAGLSGNAISGLFALWSLVGLSAEVPAGALADRVSRRSLLVAAGVLQAVAFAMWTSWPTFPVFAAGFVVWGIAGALTSGTIEALLYDDLAALDATDRYAEVFGRITAVSLVAQLPAAGLATVLYAAGGFPLVGWVSVAICLLASVLAGRLPSAPGVPSDDDPGYVATLRAGVRSAVRHPVVRAGVLAVAILGGLDAMDEYFPLMAYDWGVSTAWTPIAVVAIPLAGAAGAALGARVATWRWYALPPLLALSALAFGVAGVAGVPAGLAAVAAGYLAYHAIQVAVGVWLQDRIDGQRATVTSVAELGIGLVTFVVYAAWVARATLGVAALVLLVAVALPPLLRRVAGRP